MTSGTRAEAGFSAYLEARRTEIEDAIAQALPRPPACPPLVAEAIRYSLEAGGKRLRPVLTLAAAEAIASAQAEDLPRRHRSPRRGASRCPRRARSSSFTPTR